MSKPVFDNILTRHPLVVTFLFITLCLLPTLVIRDFTPDNELRYLQIADEAIENGTAFAFTLDGEAYADKPPLYFWIVMLCKLLLGKHSMLLLSLFSLIPAFVIIAIMDKWIALEKVTDRMAIAFMMMTSALFLGLSVFLRMDMLMTMFILLALRSFWLMYTEEGNTKRQSFLLPVWIFLALFVKGPVGILMPPVAIVCFLLVKRRGREIGKYLGWKTWGIIAGLCLLWFLGAYLEGGKGYIQNLLVHQTVDRAVNSFHHKAPFWYYFAAIWYIFPPYMFLVIGALFVSLSKSGGRERGNADDVELFFTVTIISTFVMLSLFSSKMAIYLAPIMPFMVMLFVEVLRRTGWKKWMTWSLAVPVGLMGIVALAVFIGLCFGDKIPALAGILSQFPFWRFWALKLATLVLLSGAVFSLYYLFRKKLPSISLIFIGASMLLTMYVAASRLSQANDWVGYGNLCKTIPSDAEVATVRIRRARPMKVYLGREVSDYQNDFEKFKAAEVDVRTLSDGPLVLVTRTEKLAKDAGLAAFVEGHDHWFVGPYCAVKYNPDNNNPSITEQPLDL